MKNRRDRGLCYNCDKQYAPGHCCKCQTLFLLDAQAIEGAVSDPIIYEHDGSESESVAISVHAISGFTSPQTINVRGCIKK